MRGYFALVNIAVGIAVIVVTAAHGGGQVGYLFGSMIIVLGVGRLYLFQVRRRRH
jgi:hypothetical protein